MCWLIALYFSGLFVFHCNLHTMIGANADADADIDIDANADANADTDADTDSTLL